MKIRAIKEAEAEAARTEIQAKADAEAKFMAGQGIARQRQAIMSGLRESVNSFKTEAGIPFLLPHFSPPPALASSLHLASPFAPLLRALASSRRLPARRCRASSRRR